MEEYERRELIDTRAVIVAADHEVLECVACIALDESALRSSRV
jgi:hypothetical protein